jgi:hypothetical protein
MRPTSFMCPICAMPTVMVVKMIGAISIRISLMKPSPSGRIASPRDGQRMPTSTPSTIPAST